MKLMLVTGTLQPKPAGGREMLAKLNHDILREAYGDELAVLQLPHAPIRGLRMLAESFRGHINGVSPATIAKALDMVRSDGIAKVFVDGSNHGELVRSLKAQAPSVEICTFFHNVEARFFWGAVRHASSWLRGMAVLFVNYLAERKAVKFSDKIIALSERDSQLLRTLYGRPADFVSPIALHDKYEPSSDSAPEPADRFALFVGGAFYANRAGIAWYVRNVAPRLRIKTCVVGKGFEGMERDLAIEGKVEVVGPVEKLADWYNRCAFVVAPIFDGSGMKTKVAEAMMFGKKIVGTPEAFSGYEAIAPSAGRVCATADEFVAAIEDIDSTPTKTFDQDLRTAYESTYSFPAAKARLKRAIETPIRQQ